MKRYIVILAAILFSACSGASLVDLNVKGSAELSLDPTTMRTAFPHVDNQPSYYRIDGTHNAGPQFDVTSADTTIHIGDLAPGIWEIRVRAYNSADQLIAEGTGTLSVEPGGNSNMTIVLYNALGTGSLDFQLVWNPELLHQASLSVSLARLSGEPATLNYAETPGLAAGLTDNLSAGFYRLDTRLYDGTISVMGSVETVLIQEGVATEVNLDYTQINKAAQCMNLSGTEFTISWENSDPSSDDFNVYFREHGTWNWILLGSTGSGSINTFTVHRGILTYGVYDFAVSALSGGVESELHTSMDDTAVPATGWYIDWKEL